VTVTVFVTPVGKAVMLTDEVPAPVVVIVEETTGLMEFDRLVDPHAVEVLDIVGEAVTVPVTRGVVLCPIERVRVGEADCVLEEADVREYVTLLLDVLDELVDPVVVLEPVEEALTFEEPEYVAESVIKAVEDRVEAGEGLGAGAREPVMEVVTVAVSFRPVWLMVVELVDVLDVVELSVGVEEPVWLADCTTVPVGLPVTRIE
jgi:hypothetical protein